MSYKNYLNKVIAGIDRNKKLSMMCSGEDSKISERVFEDIISSANGMPIIIIDDKHMENSYFQLLTQTYGYSVHDAFSGDLTLYNILQLNNLKDKARIREILEIAGYSEAQKEKLVAYLFFVKHIETISENTQTKLSYPVLAGYSSNKRVENKLQTLLNKNIITEEERMELLAKYAEISSAAADFENLLLLMSSLITSEQSLTDILSRNRSAIYVPVNMLGQDIVMKNIVMKLILYTLTDTHNRHNSTVVFLDNGTNDRSYYSSILNEKNVLNCPIHCISRDIFTMEQQTKELLYSCMDVKIYSKHSSMPSCETIEKLLGDIDVIKTTYGVDYDRRWRANTPWDCLLGNNKVEHYTKNAPTREPRYRKEDIYEFGTGDGIIDVCGNTAIFNL